jgi:mono/diheme cytochrome c family protein
MKFSMLVAGAAALLIQTGLDAQQPRPAVPSARTAVTDVPLGGKATYDVYCAGCHGSQGRGDGPAVTTLTTTVGDLTTLSARNGGTYPRARVRAAVLNMDRPITAHRTGDMPVWGTIFQILDRSNREAQVRVDNVVAYLETLQVPPSVSVESGGQLYVAYCERCHGPNGRGGTVPGVGRDAPDLTRFAQRNGGLFPSVQVRRIIDGREVMSHVARNMPVWGDVFQSLPGGRAATLVASRIDALTTYLEAIQVRNGE